MTWVVKIPKRPDFCGCPPCPLCFDWQTEPPAARVQDAWVQEIINGFSKFTDDMLGGKTPTAAEKETLEKAAEAIHVANLGASERIDAELREADQAQALKRMIDDKVAHVAQKTDYAPAKQQALDDMEIDWQKVEQKDKEAAESKKRRESAFSTIPDYAAFVQAMNSQISDVMLYVSSKPTLGSFYKWGVMDLAKPEIEPVKKSEKEIRREQAEADAKARMKAQSRQEIRR